MGRHGGLQCPVPGGPCTRQDDHPTPPGSPAPPGPRVAPGTHVYSVPRGAVDGGRRIARGPADHERWPGVCTCRGRLGRRRGGERESLEEEGQEGRA